MSRIADAFAQAGQSLPDVDVASWEQEAKAADAHLSGRIPDVVSRLPVARSETDDLPDHALAVARKAIDAELATAVRRIFLSRRGAVRSVLFCSVSEDVETTVAWRAAVLLAEASGRQVAFVDVGRHSVVPATLVARQSHITRIEWAEYRDRPDLLKRFAFVILNVTALTGDDVVPLAQDVDGLVMLLDQHRTPLITVERLVAALRSEGVRLLGAILTTESHDR